MSTTSGSLGFGSASSCLTAISTLLRSRAGPQLPCGIKRRQAVGLMGARVHWQPMPALQALQVFQYHTL